MKMEMPSIRDLKPGSKNLTMVLIVLEIGKPSTTKDGHEVRSIRVADKSASMNLSLWGEPGTLLQPGDIIRISKAYCSLFKSHLTLYIGKGGDLQRLGDFCFVFSESPNVSEEPFHTPVSNQSGGTGSPSAGPASNSTGSSGANAQVRPPLPSHPRKSGNLAK